MRIGRTLGRGANPARRASAQAGGQPGTVSRLWTGPAALGAAVAALTFAAGIALPSPVTAAIENCEISRFDIFGLKLGQDGSASVSAINTIVRRRPDLLVLDPKKCSTEGDTATTCPLYQPGDSSNNSYSETDATLVPTGTRAVEVRTATSTYCADAKTWLAEADRRLDREFRMGEAIQQLDGTGPLAAHVDRGAVGKVDGERSTASMRCLESVTVRSELPGEWASVLRVYFREGDSETPDLTAKKINAEAERLSKDESRKTNENLLPIPPSELAKLADQSVYRIEWYVHWLNLNEWQMLARDRMRDRMLNQIYPPLKVADRQIIRQGRTHRYEWRAPSDHPSAGCRGCYVTFDLSYEPQMILVASLGQYEEYFHARQDRRLVTHRLDQNDRNSVDMLLEPAKDDSKDYVDQERPFDLHRLPMPRPKPKQQASIKMPPPVAKAKASAPVAEAPSDGAPPVIPAEGTPDDLPPPGVPTGETRVN